MTNKKESLVELYTNSRIKGPRAIVEYELASDINKIIGEAKVDEPQQKKVLESVASKFFNLPAVIPSNLDKIMYYVKMGVCQDILENKEQTVDNVIYFAKEMREIRAWEKTIDGAIKQKFEKAEINAKSNQNFNQFLSEYNNELIN